MSKIEWTDKTWNPITGCSPISEGCKNCYAKRMANRLRGRCGYPRINPFGVTVHMDKIPQPLKWKKPRKIFVCSMGDLFHEDVPFEWIDDVFFVMAQCQQHVFQILTKRPSRMLEWTKTISSRRPIGGHGVCTGGSPFCMGEYCKTHDDDVGYCGSPWPLPNIWLGVTAENQRLANERIPILLDIPAVVRFVSCEPLLGSIKLSSYLKDGIDWVIVGGETGPKARKMVMAWSDDISYQCSTSNVPFFFKHYGSHTPTHKPIEPTREFPFYGNV